MTTPDLDGFKTYVAWTVTAYATHPNGEVLTESADEVDTVTTKDES